MNQPPQRDLRVFVSALTLLAAALAGSLSGCSSVPISTSLSLSQIREEDIYNLEPDEIRAAVEVPDSVRLDASKIRLGVKIVSPSLPAPGPDDQIWPLEFVSSGRYVPLVISQADAGRKQFLYKLTADAQKRFEAMLREARAHPDPATKVNVDIRFDNALIAPPEVRSIKASAWVQVRRVDGALLLISNRDVGLPAASAGKP